MTKSLSKSHPFHRVIHFVAPHLPRYDLLVLLKVDQETRKILLPWVYTHLNFQGLRVSPYTALHRFVSLADKNHSGSSLVRYLVLTGLEECLCEQVPVVWLSRLLERCPNVQGITSIGCTLLNDKVLLHNLSSSPESSLAWTRLRYFHHDGSSLSLTALNEALRNMPFLEELTLNGIRAEPLLVLLRQNCHQLRKLILTDASLSGKHTSPLPISRRPTVMSALAHLDLSRNGQLTSQSALLAHEMVGSLTFLSLRECSAMRNQDLIALTPHLTSLRILDVSGCPSLSLPAFHTLALHTKLTRLTASVRLLCGPREAMSPRPSGLTLLNSTIPYIISLELHGLLPEADGSYWRGCMTACSRLRKVILYREASQHDFLLGSYSTPAPISSSPPSYASLVQEEWGQDPWAGHVSKTTTDRPFTHPENAPNSWDGLFPWINASKDAIQVVFHTASSSSSFSMSSW
ncbi:hypothetical protein BJ684DRAFT_18180 [Piptocephalis cylindrospora]|uniref:F-box domain-containing protein n=1 Tax=Piptocephalis cylindrospora TaxID=1907219 RepID=A0A4P9Y8R5_9FUNG|nr:hypothetical protein BJ684DRAFT_18180 [Piptocephalis cylindrospora]|eukprot:RKP15513.1 hypothetical protein BJ684DRAFT_18180 [Piptocephalis cylindrospora]